jgi:hypothetical protein
VDEKKLLLVEVPQRMSLVIHNTLHCQVGWTSRLVISLLRSGEQHQSRKRRNLRQEGISMNGGHFDTASMSFESEGPCGGTTVVDYGNCQLGCTGHTEARHKSSEDELRRILCVAIQVGAEP